MAADLNDPRTIIPTLRQGDAIRESFVVGIADAINGRRGVSNPPQQVYRPKGPSGFDHVVNAKSWTWIDLAAPSTVQAQNGVVKAFSDTNNSFDGTTNGRKGVVNFERNISISGTERAVFLDLGQLAGNAVLTGSYTGAGTVESIQISVKITPITAAFTTNLQTWNNRGSLTLGTAIFNSTYLSAQVNTPGGGTWITSEILQQNPSGNQIFGFLANTTTWSCYGLLIEVEPSITILSGQTLSSIQASFQSNGHGSAFLHPALVLPAS